MSTEKMTEVKKEAIESEVHAQPIENQGILEEAAHLGGRIAGAAKNTVVAAKDAVVQASQHAVEATKDAAVGAGEFAKEKAAAAGEFTKDKAVAAKEFTKDKAVAAKDYVCGKEHVRDEPLGEKTDLPRDVMMDKGSNLDAGFTTEKKDVQDVLKGGYHDSGKRDFSTAFNDTTSSTTEHRDWFRDTGVDKNEVMEERRNVMGELTSAEIDKRVGVDKVHVEKKFEGDKFEKKLDADLPRGEKFETGTGLAPHQSSWFKDTGVDKKEVMKGRENVVSATSEDIDKRLGVDKPYIEKGALEHGHPDWFKDTGVDKQEVMEERRAVLGPESGIYLEGGIGERRAVFGERSESSKDRFDNTSNTVANKAGQLKDTVSTKAGQLKDSALEKGGQLKDAALEKGGQWKDAALEKGGQWKDAAADKASQLKDDAMIKGSQLKEAALDKGQQLKESAIIKGQQAKESALETGDQLKGKAIDAGHAAQEKGIALKAASDKGFVQQEARADKENTRY